MATWVRQGTGTAPTATDADLVGTYALDNGTAPADFDPAGVTSVQAQWTVTGSGFSDDSWNNTAGCAVVTGATEISQHPGEGSTGNQNVARSTDHTDSTGIPAGLSAAQWEAAAVRGDGTAIPDEWCAWVKTKGPDGFTLAVSALTVTITYTPAAAGPNEGSASGSIGWVGSASGVAVHEGASSGSVAWVGAADGAATHQGSGAGAVSWVGSADGVAPAVGGAEGSASGAVAWVGSADGTTAREGWASGAVGWAGTADGVAVHEGSSSGAVAWTGSADGTADHQGVSTGSVTWVGSAIGVAPSVGSAEGTAAGAITWVGTVNGETVHSGSASGSVAWVGVATSAVSPSGHRWVEPRSLIKPGREASEARRHPGREPSKGRRGVGLEGSPVQA